MPEPAATPSPATARRRLHFSLRTLLLTTLLLASAATLYRNWEPWKIQLTFPAGYHFVFAPDGQKLAYTHNKKIFVVNTATGVQLAQFDAHTNPILNLEFDATGTLLATLSEDKTACVWDLAAGRQRIKIDLAPRQVLWMRFSPDGQRLIQSASTSGSLALWDTTTGRNVSNIYAHEKYVFAATFSRNSRTLLTASADGTARLWDATTGEQLRVFTEPRDGLYQAVFSPDETRVLTASLSGHVQVWDLQTGIALFKLDGLLDDFQTAQFSNDGRRIFAVGNDSVAKEWDATTGSVVATLKTTLSPVHRARYSPDGQRMLLMHKDGLLGLWDATTHRYLATLGKYSDLPRFSPDSKRLIITRNGEPPTLWLRSRPEQWWGITTLPEFWLTLLFLAALAWSLHRDRRQIKNPQTSSADHP